MMVRRLARGWCFTINNYTFDDILSLFVLDVDYLVFGFETGDKNGVSHIQGYLYVKNKIDFSTLQKVMVRAHLIKARGTLKQNYDYCGKSGEFYSFGDYSVEQPRQGSRTDLSSLQELLKVKPISEVAEERFVEYMRYGRMMEVYKSRMMPLRTEMPIVEWIYGSPGVGKTRYALQRCKTFYIKDETKWWDGYEQQEAIILDDYDGQWPFRSFLRLLDRYPYRGEIKGGTVQINSPYIIITADKSISDMYPLLTPMEMKQLRRRIKIERQIKSTDIVDEEQELSGDATAKDEEIGTSYESRAECRVRAAAGKTSTSTKTCAKVK